MNIAPHPELGACIVAGRRAAAAEMLRAATAMGLAYAGVPPDQMTDEYSSRLAVRGFDITSGIDAAIVEALAWKPVPAPRRKWWRFW